MRKTVIFLSILISLLVVACDGGGGSSENLPPQAIDWSTSTDEDTAVNITLQAVDPENALLIWNINLPPTHGSLTGTLPDLTYTPNPNYNGPDSFSFYVSDGSLNSNIAVVQITVDPINDPPLVSAGSNVAIDEGDIILFSGSFSDVDGTAPYIISWNFGDGNFASSILDPVHSYSDDGMFTVTLSVADDQNASSLDTLVAFVSNVPPIASIIASTTVAVSESVQFIGGVLDPGTMDSHSYSWDFGDGNSMAGTLSPVHAYASTGTYSVTFTVTDDDGGMDSEVLQVTVEASPEETALVIEVLGGQGQPMDDVSFILDGSQTVITGSQLSAGQVFVNATPGDHAIQLDTASLIDPQGGIGWVPLASQISGEAVPLSFDNRPFAGGADVLIVPVNLGEITVVTIYLDDILKSPMDNQWLTDGLNTANPYRLTGVDEFTASPTPTFWWRQDPSLGDTVNYTFQLWRDNDGDTRYPLGVINHGDYNAFSRTPDWEESNQAMFNPVVYSSGSTIWPLGWTYAYAGSSLGTSPSLGDGEYVWRVIQDNPDRGVSVETKLGAFYTWSGYYYVSTESGGLDMSVSGPWGIGGGPSQNADHRDVLSFVEGAPNILSADVMGTPFDSVDSSGYRQRTSALFSASLAAGSGTTNQLTLLYNTDEDGQAFVSQTSVSGYLGQIRVLATNKQHPLPTPEPHLQSKEFRLSYYTTDDKLVNFPPPTFGGSGIFFLGTLDDPDWMDPIW